MNKPEITAELVAKENWAAFERFSPSKVYCVNDHLFHSHAKFSGFLVAIVSKDPCPTCGAYELKSAASGWESQSLEKKDVGSA